MNSIQKLLPIVIVVGLFACLNASTNIQDEQGRAFVPPQPRRMPPCARSDHQRIKRVISDQEISEALSKLQKEPYSIQKLSAVRNLMMRSRRSEVSEQSQAKFNTILMEAYKNYNKSDRREVMILRMVLSFAQQSSMLGETDKENVKNLLSEFAVDSDESKHRPMNIKNLHTISAKNDYQTKANSLYQILRRPQIAGKADKYVQSETSSAIHDLYRQRPLTEIARLSKLQDILSLAQHTPLLSTINQYEVKEIMLPEVAKNLEKAKKLANNNTQQSPNKVDLAAIGQVEKVV